MAESKVESSTSTSTSSSTRPDCASSPPPNCSICLGPFSNQCVSDSCRHMFCFKCLLEWSRIKAECPLCKQPFKSIIHNVRSDSEYDQHMVQTQTIPNEIIHHLPTSSARHQFHFRTTFTVDTHGEHAIQQMLLTHPLTNGGQIHFSGYTPRRRRRDSSATTFRRSIYNNNLWVSAIPDVTGTYRDVSPSFFRNYPGARTRLAPWLNRELNALLFENTPLIMHLVDQIMDYLLRHHICSRAFRNFLTEYLGNKTDHFVHEFYNFMRSPFDMIGYDRHIVYTERPRSPAPFIDVETDSDSSDVILVDVQPQPRLPDGNVVIDLLDSDSSDNSVLLSTSTWPMPMPVIQPMVISSDDEPPVLERAPISEPTASTSAASNNNNNNNVDNIVSNNNEQSENHNGPMLPLKLRLKHKRLSKEKLKKRKRRSNSSSSSSSSSSTWTDSDSSTNSENDRQKRKRKRSMKKRRHGKYKDIWVISSGGSSSSDSDETDLEDNLPLSLVLNQKSNKKMKHKKKKKHSHKKSKSKNKDKDRKKSKLNETESRDEAASRPMDAFSASNYELILQNLPSCSYSSPNQNDLAGMPGVDMTLEMLRRTLEGSSSSDEDEGSGYDRKPLVKSEIHDVRHLHNNNNSNNDINNSNSLSPSFDELELSRRSEIDVVLKNDSDTHYPDSYYRQK